MLTTGYSPVLRLWEDGLREPFRAMRVLRCGFLRILPVATSGSARETNRGQQLRSGLKGPGLPSQEAPASETQLARSRMNGPGLDPIRVNIP
jgi:hypothetical protein